LEVFVTFGKVTKELSVTVKDDNAKTET